MALKIVGSGLGRTGTKSLHTALPMLGFGPCHHMMEVFMNPQSVPLWIAAGEGQADWDAIFQNYNAMVDYPGAAYWREILAHYPDAKVLHSVRDPDAWFESTQATIFAPGSLVETAPPPMDRFFGHLVRRIGADIHDRSAMIDYFHRHTAEVKAAVPAEQLLVYEVGSGWEPLCAFLGVPVPAESFPSENSREEFRARVASMAAAGPPAAH